MLKGQEIMPSSKMRIRQRREHALQSQELSLTASNAGRWVVGRLRSISEQIEELLNTESLAIESAYPVKIRASCVQMFI